MAKEIKQKEPTIKDAVIEVAKNMVTGQTLLGYMVVNRMKEALYRNGYNGHPLETTLLARFREIEDLYKIDSVQGVSEYTKRVEKVSNNQYTIRDATCNHALPF